jgi:glycosyltransferase involved in cell wall biosynthesis
LKPPAGNGEPLVSVVVPCYNQGHFLAEAVESALTQDYSPLEITVVDDGSTDETSAVARAFAGIRLVRQRNSGTATARNRGFGESRGDYLLFLDADDRLAFDAIPTQVAELEAHPECGFVWGHIRRITAGGGFLDEPPQAIVEADHYRTLLCHNDIWTPGAILYRRAAFESAGGFEAAAGGSADLDLNLRIARAWPLRSHGRIVLEYREHAASQSENAAEMLRSSLWARQRQRPSIRGDAALETALREGIRGDRRYYGKRLFHQIRRDARAGRWTRALGEAGVLLRYDALGFARRALHLET